MKNTKQPNPRRQNGLFRCAQKTILVKLFAALAILMVSSVSAALPEKPNILMILVDDLGWQDVGFAGAEFFETPNVDRLAAQGMIFSQAYSSGSNCAPTRACLMSGTYVPRHKIFTPGGKAKGELKYMPLLVPSKAQENASLAKKARSMIPCSTQLASHFVCIPEILKPAGYATARLGKWHLGNDVQGFDLSSSDGIGGPQDREAFYADADVAEQLTDRALTFIEKNQHRPFFVYLSHWDVHIPLVAKERVVSEYKAKLKAIPEEKRKNYNPVYAAMIEAVDRSVGRVVAKIDELDLASNTLIVFTSDNGGLPRFSQLMPMRGSKGSLLEGGIRVPACMRWTGTISPGSTCDTPVASVDFLPTFARLAGAKLPRSQHVDGVDLSPLFHGNKLSERSIFWHYPLYLSGSTGFTRRLPDGNSYVWRSVPSTAMRRGDFKLIEFHEDNRIELYNLKRDPGERNNLAATFPELASRMHTELNAWQKKTKAPISSEPNPNYVGLGQH